jgi:hypothetical protein
MLPSREHREHPAHRWPFAQTIQVAENTYSLEASIDRETVRETGKWGFFRSADSYDKDDRSAAFLIGPMTKPPAEKSHRYRCLLDLNRVAKCLDRTQQLRPWILRRILARAGRLTSLV